MLVFIENKKELIYVLWLLDLANISYTTNIKDNYNTILITDFNSKIEEMIKNKKVILLTDFIEEKILNKKFFLPPIHNLKIITSLEILNSRKDTKFIPSIIPNINIKKNKQIYDLYKLSKNKKRIIVIDLKLEHIKEVNELVENFPKYEIIYIGYRKLKENEMLNSVIWIKYINLEIYNDLCNISNIVIIYDKNIKINYLYVSILTHTEIFLIEDNIHENYLIASKHYYNFKNNDLINKIKKYVTERTSSLNDNAFLLIKNNTLENYIKEIKKFLK